MYPSLTTFYFEQESFQEALQQASQPEEASGSGPQVVDPSTRLDCWVKSAGGKTRGRLYGAGDMSSRYRPGVSSLTQESRASTSTTPVPNQYSAQLAAVEERARAAEEEARQARQTALDAVRAAEVRQQEQAADFQRQLRELASSIANIHSARRHPDDDEEDDGEDDDEEEEDD